MEKPAIIISAFGALTMAGCGGGSSDCGVSPRPPPPPTGGIGRTGIAIGPISTFGSVVVNGVRYATASATFTINDAAGVEADLSVGQIVVVKGKIDANGTTGTANEVIFGDSELPPMATNSRPAAETSLLQSSNGRTRIPRRSCRASWRRSAIRP